ncbi:MAG: hypothetical protein KF858_10570 [Candidatus Sumerlaeia bacterium]|nr:hypothetical protein [Candidatus Sumerlaeia bacterium]
MKPLGHVACLVVLTLLMTLAPAEEPVRGSLIVRFVTAPEDTPAGFDEVRLILNRRELRQGQVAVIKVHDVSIAGTTFERRFDNLVPGRHFVVAVTGRPDEFHAGDRPGAFHGLAVVDVPAGGETEARIEYELPDLSELEPARATATQAGRVVDYRGQPREGIDVQAMTELPTIPYYPVARARTDSNGRFVFEGLRDGRRYQVVAAGMQAGSITVGEADEARIRLSILPGERLPDIAIQWLDTDATTPLIGDDTRPILLLTWATWCGTCYNKMETMQDTLRGKPDWATRVRVLAVATDDEVEIVREVLAERGWTGMRFGWLLPEAPAEVRAMLEEFHPMILEAGGTVRTIAPIRLEQAIVEVLE